MDTVYNFHEMIDIIDVICTLRTELHPINTDSDDVGPANLVQCKIDNMAESDLKALLEEAITYKCPKDREHKSATFNELLSKTEMEDQEQNFPFTSRPVQSKRASGRPTQGGSLQDLQEASLHDYCYSEFPFANDCYTNLGGLGMQTSRRHHGIGSSGVSYGPGGGDRAMNPRQKKYTSSVSSRQREGGSLPSNVNVEYPVFNEVGHHHTTGTITKIKKREGGSKSDYSAMLLTAPMTSAGAAELITTVAEVAGGTGFSSGMKNTESQLIDGCGGGIGGSHTVIDMGELESDETQHLLAHDALQQNLYDSVLDDFEGNSTDLYGSTSNTGGGSTTGGAGSGCSALKKIPRFPTASYTSHAKLEIGEPSSTVRPSSVHHVDKTVSLPMLESNKSVDITPIQLGSSYQAVKCIVSSDSSKSDQAKHVMMGISTNNAKYITTQSFNQIISQKYLDENGNSVQQFGSSASSSAGGGGSGTGGNTGGGASGNNSSSLGGSGGAGTGSGGGKKSRKQPKSDRNTVLVIPENIEGYRGKDTDIESLVCYIENKDKQKEGKGSGGGGGNGTGNSGSGTNPKNGTLFKVGASNNSAGNGNSAAGVENGLTEEKAPKKKGEKKKEKAKLKKSNSLEELSSCSRKKQQAEDEQNTQRQPNNTVEQQTVSRVTTTHEGTEPSVVTLRNNKTNKKGQNCNSTASSSASSTTSSQSSKDTATSTATGGGKRGERRSWGTEELSFLEDKNQVGANGNEKAEEKSSSSKKESKKEAKDSAEAAIPTFNLTKKRDSLRMSVESLSAVSVSGTAETAEFHVVTKKKKMKKKSQSLFAEETNTGAGGSISANNKRHSTVGQGYSMGSAGSGGRNANVTGRYQPSHNFTNDRDVYMSSLTTSGNDVSRRKSTSSMPPSEKSDSSDAESVQSLPIEPTRKQQQKSSAAGHQPNRNQQSGMVPQSYADIARIPNADKLNNNLLGNSTSNSTTSALDSTSADRWPPVQATASEDLAQALKSPSAFPELVPDSSSSTLPQAQHQNQQQYQQQYVNNSVNIVSSNNVGNNNKATYSQSLLIAAASTKATSGTEEEDVIRQRVASGKLVASSVVNSESITSSGCTASTNSNNNYSSSSSSSTSSNGGGSNSKLALHKSKSVDNTDIYYSNEHYPALEKTVKSAKVGPLLAAATNSTNLVVSSATGQFQNVPTYPASMSAVNSNTNQNALSGAKKSKKKDSTFLVAPASTITANEVETINNARNTASFQPTLMDTINNNPVLIENVDESVIDYSQNNGLINRTPNGPVNLAQSHPPQSTPKNYASSNNNSSVSVSSTTSNAIVSSKRNKKEKSTSQPVTQPQQQQQTHGTLTHSHHSVPTSNTNAVVNSGSNHRPAVIIMNDNNDSSGSTKHEFTFGFDIDQELLFGDFQEDDLSMIEQPTLPSQQQQYHQYQNQQKPSSHHGQEQQQQQQQPIYHNSSENNVPSPTSNTSAQSTDLGYSSMQQSSLSISSPSSSSSSSQHSQQQQPPPPQHQHQHHYHNQSQHQQQQQPDTTYETLNNSTDPDTYRDSIEHKFHQPPPQMVPPLYSQPPPQLPPPHVLAAHQQQQQQQQQHHLHHHHQSRQPRPVTTTNHYNLPPPPVIPGTHHNLQQQQQPPLPLKQDSATNTSPAMVISANTAPAIMTVPPPPLPPVASGVTAPIPLVVAQPPTTVVLLPPVVISVNTNTAGYVSSSRSNSNNNSPAATVSCNSSSSNNTTSLINQSTISSGSNSSISSIASQQEPKPQRQTANNVVTPTAVQQPQQQQQQQQHQTTGSAVPVLREKVKEINLRFIAPEQLPTNHNHDKIVNFVGMAWEDIICGTNGSAKYYDGQ
ncbi:homeobox protein 5 isoform X2 [Wyeomyia smithii]|uniref:homeobox protein 5 isoform X2 n=1 Tax=Wyeomyia smithii TaxID=174621 RepID=UPI002468029E|nr:homeobox protein 5 isoform X2 [Wyeomyia smithii]